LSPTDIRIRILHQEQIEPLPNHDANEISAVSRCQNVDLISLIQL